MAIEIEAKFKVADHVAIRQQLASVGAARVGAVLETNTFFDDAKNSLRKSNRGLRLRINRDVTDGGEQNIVTFKGPQKSGPLKSREEIEFKVDEAERAVQFLAALGFSPTLSFEKRRESWTAGGCKVELDELPHFGTFVEIEGPDEATIESVRTKLRLNDLPHINKSYSSMIADFLDEHRITNRIVTFGDSHA